jgi:hypothetical protein
MKLLALMLFLVAVPSGAVSAAPAVRIMVVESRKVILPEPFEKVSLASEVQRQLEAAGCPVAGVCRDGDCLATAREAGATDVVMITAEYQRERYSCALRVESRGIAGELKQNQSYGGDSCPAADVVEQAKAMAAASCTQLKTQAARLPIQGPPLGGKEAGSDRGVSLTGVGLVAGGVVVAGLGAYLWYLDGRCAHSGVTAGQTRCGDNYDTKVAGISLTLAGAAAAGVGAFLLWRSPEGTAVGAGPGRIWVAGRF